MKNLVFFLTKLITRIPKTDFNFNINLLKGLNVILGNNGSGKTTILNVIDALNNEETLKRINLGYKDLEIAYYLDYFDEVNNFLITLLFIPKFHYK